MLHDEEGSNRQENITDWALEQFRSHYGVNGIYISDNVILSEARAHQPRAESKDPAFAGSAGKAPGSSADKTQGLSTRPASLRSVGLARDDRTRDVGHAGEGARATRFKSDLDVFRAFVKSLPDLGLPAEAQAAAAN